MADDMAGLIIFSAGVFFFFFLSCFPSFCDPLPLLSSMVHEAGLRDSAWSRRCEGRGGGVCGVAVGGEGTVDGGVATGAAARTAADGL